MTMTARSIPATLLAATLFWGSASAVRAAEDADAYAKGRDAIFAERWEEARRLFEDFARRYPQSAWADDAHYWMGMSLYELGEAERAYTVLKAMDERHPDSPWSDDARALMIRCAEAVLKEAPARRETSSGRFAEYEAFIERSTRDRSAKVQLLAIDTMLGTRPERATEFLPRLADSGSQGDAASLVLDRFFGDSRVKVTIEDRDRGFTEGNIAVIVRDGGKVQLLGLSEALDAASGGGLRRFGEAMSAEIREKLLRAERGLVKEGGPGSVEVAPSGGVQAHSAIVKVVDGEVHYYRGGTETLRVMVLNRNAGFRPDNVRIFLESPSGVRELTLQEARAIPATGTSGLGVSTARFLKATLAIIEIDLSRAQEPAPR